MLLFIYVFYASVFIAGIFSPGSWRQPQLALLFPFHFLTVALLLASFIDLSVRAVSSQAALRAVKALTLVLIALLIAGRATKLWGYYSYFGTISRYCSSVDSYTAVLCKRVLEEHLFPIFFMEENCKAACYLVSRGKVHGLVLGHIKNQYFVSNVYKQHLKNTDTFYVIKDNEITPFPVYSSDDDKYIYGAAKENGLNASKYCDILSDREPYVVYTIFKLTRNGGRKFRT
jgi:hypothetical protein